LLVVIVGCAAPAAPQVGDVCEVVAGAHCALCATRSSCQADTMKLCCYGGACDRPSAGSPDDVSACEAAARQGCDYEEVPACQAALSPR
jgi:hypothetical protein